MSATYLLSPEEILWKTLEAYGHDPKPIFFQEGIDHDMFLKPGMRVSYRKVDNLWAKAAELIEDQCFGLRAAEFWHPSHFNALGYAWLASSTLRQALNRLARYVHIISEETDTRLEDTTEGLTLTLSDSMHLPAHMDLTMAIIMFGCRLNYGAELNPVAVSFIHAEPSCAEKYLSYFNTPVNFSAKSDSLTLSAVDVDLRLPSGNPYLASINDQVIIRYLAELDREDVVHRVKAAIIDELPTGGVSDEKVAPMLNMSVRSLQRKLQQADTTFHTLVDEVRLELAEVYVHDPSISLNEIPFVLGFSEYSAFSRAFKRWTGNAPSEVRMLG